MKSLWKVTSNPIGDTVKYAVYRLLDVKALDHSGNREHATGYMDDRAAAQLLADQMNEQSMKGAAMTLTELEGLDTLMITPLQAGQVLGLDPSSIRWQARNEPELLGFPVIAARSRVKIPRVPFIKFVKGELQNETL